MSLILHCLRTSITVGGTSFNSEVVSLQEFLHPPSLLFSWPAVSSSISRPTVMCKSTSPIAWLSFSNNIILFNSRAHLNLFIYCEINFVRFLNSWSICIQFMQFSDNFRLTLLFQNAYYYYGDLENEFLWCMVASAPCFIIYIVNWY